MDLLDWPYRLKSARRKKRLVKKDRDKQLISLAKLQSSLSDKKWHLPIVPLEHPYQRGWKRFFVLRDDMQRSEKAPFYHALLDKINTVKYHHDKNFKRRKRKRWRYHYEEQPQTLRAISPYEWWNNKLGFSDAEKACFYRKETWEIRSKAITVSYEFAEPWRFVLVTRPHIVREVKMMDEVVEQELKAIDNYIDNHNLWWKIQRLTKGRSRHRWDDIDKPKYKNKLKNQPRYTDKLAYLD